MKRFARLTAAMLAVAIVFVGCDRGGGRDDATVQPAEIVDREGVVSRSYAGTMKIELDSAVKGRFEGETPIRIVTLVGLQAPRESWLLSVGLEAAVDIGGGLVGRPAFDLVGYHGTDTYTVEKPKPGGLTEEELEEARKTGTEP